jgi:hypothetical protein
VEERDAKGSYAESRDKQAEFEELVREDDDWQEAVDDVVKGDKPDSEADEPASSGL